MLKNQVLSKTLSMRKYSILLLSVFCISLNAFPQNSFTLKLTADTNAVQFQIHRYYTYFKVEDYPVKLDIRCIDNDTTFQILNKQKFFMLEDDGYQSYGVFLKPGLKFKINSHVFQLDGYNSNQSITFHETDSLSDFDIEITKDIPDIQIEELFGKKKESIKDVVKRSITDSTVFVIFYFWDANCPPCVGSIPLMNELIKKNCVLITFANDTDLETCKELLKKNNAGGYHAVLDENVRIRLSDHGFPHIKVYGPDQKHIRDSAGLTQILNKLARMEKQMKAQ